MDKTKAQHEDHEENDTPLFDMSCMPVTIQMAQNLSRKPLSADQVQAMMHRSPSGGRHVNKPFTPADYNSQRPAEANPQGWENIFKVCDIWYEEEGIVRNIIDLMADFCVAGIQVSSPDIDDQRTLRTWFHKVQGTHISERIANMLYRLGNVGIRKLYAEGSTRIRREWQDAVAMRPEIKIPRVSTSSALFPYKYVPLPPQYFRVPDPIVSAFLDEPHYELNISRDSLYDINTTLSGEIDNKKLISQLRVEDVKEALKTGKSVKLDNNRFTMLHFKKDTYKRFAKPLIYSALKKLTLYDKMMLADRNVVDSAIKHITFVHIGNPEKNIVATQEHVKAMAQDINDAGAGGSKSYIITPAPIELHADKGTLATFLGKQKFDAVLDAIYATFGIPSALTGTASGAAANNYMAMKVLVKKLEYVRQILKDFWLEELKQVCRAFRIKSNVFLTYTYQELGDEAAIKTLIEAMYDRKAISVETYRYLMGMDHELEDIRIERDDNKRRQGDMPLQAGPFHSPNFENDIKKIAVQSGSHTPEDVGVRLNDIKKEPQVRKSRMEIQTDLLIKQDNNKSNLDIKRAEEQNRLDIKFETEIPSSQPQTIENTRPTTKKVVKKVVNNRTTKKVTKKLPGQSGEGRPRNQRDTAPRQERQYRGPRRT